MEKRREEPANISSSDTARQLILNSLEILVGYRGIRLNQEGEEIGLSESEREIVNHAYQSLRAYLVEREPEKVKQLTTLWNSCGRKLKQGERQKLLGIYDTLSARLKYLFERDYGRIGMFFP